MYLIEKSKIKTQTPKKNMEADLGNAYFHTIQSKNKQSIVKTLV